MYRRYIRQPRYYADFHCIGGGCVYNCCCGWRIDWEYDEVDKLKAAETSPELKRLVETAFTSEEALPGKLRIQLNDKKMCPFENEEGLCAIQKELGAEYLSKTCSSYPRRYAIGKNSVYASLYMSCGEVFKKLINDEKAMDMVNTKIGKETTITGDLFVPQGETIASAPALAYFEELVEFFLDVIGDKKHDAETNIVLGALAAQALTTLVERGEADKIPETLRSLRQQMHNGAQLKSIENIKPNYHWKLGIVAKIIKEATDFPSTVMLNDETGTLNIDRYNKGEENLRRMFEDRPFAWRNIALNLLLIYRIPFAFYKMSIFENYSIFAAAYSCMKCNAVAAAFGNDVVCHYHGREERFVGEDAVVQFSIMIARSLCHNEGKMKKALEILKEHNAVTPAYLALLVK